MSAGYFLHAAWQMKCRCAWRHAPDFNIFQILAVVGLPTNNSYAYQGLTQISQKARI